MPDQLKTCLDVFFQHLRIKYCLLETVKSKEWSEPTFNFSGRVVPSQSYARVRDKFSCRYGMAPTMQ